MERRCGRAAGAGRADFFARRFPAARRPATLDLSFTPPSWLAGSRGPACCSYPHLENAPMMYRKITCLALLLAVGLISAVSRAADKQPDTVVPLNRDVPRHKQINDRAKAGDVDLLFIGDSITQGWEGAGKEVWDKFYVSRKAMNAGIGGDRTQHILWRLDNGNIDGLKPKLAVLMIGTNNPHMAEQIAEGIKAIVGRLRAKLPEMQILVLGIFPRGADSNDPRRKENIGANEIDKKLADGKHVFYLDIGDKFLAADGTLSKEIMPDLLHLSPKGYQIWADAIEPEVSALLGGK
jgi:beta-glucosidase